MPILDLQRRLREAGRIRIGVQVPIGNGSKTRPAKIDTFRLTSQDETAIRAAGEMFGGTVNRWADAPTGEQWEVITQTSVIPVVIPPAATAFSQWYEQWSGGGCLRRCDGVTEMISDTACPCTAEDNKVCTPHSRLNVILRDLPGLGVWRLETQGWYAATELAGTVEVCIQAATRGQLLPAVLRLEQRQVKRPGETVKKFAVPVLDIQVTPSALGLVVGSQPVGALPANGESWQPIPASPAPAALGQGEVGAAIKDAGSDGPKKRKNSPPDLPPTGLNPRRRRTTPKASEPDDTGGALDGPAMIGLLMTEHGVTKRADKQRAVTQIVGREVASTKELSLDETKQVIAFMGTIGDGQPFPFVTAEVSLEGTLL